MKRSAILLLVAFLVLLPLYELVDIGEQWPHDGSLVLVLLSALFLVGLAVLCRGLAQVCVVSLQRVFFERCAAAAGVALAVTRRHSRPLLILLICLLRI